MQKTAIKGGVSVCLRLSAFARVCLRLLAFAPLRLLAFVRVCLRLLAFPRICLRPPLLHPPLRDTEFFPGVHKIGAAISGPRIADTNFMDTRIFLILLTDHCFRELPKIKRKEGKQIKETMHYNIHFHFGLACCARVCRPCDCTPGRDSRFPSLV